MLTLIFTISKKISSFDSRIFQANQVFIAEAKLQRAIKILEKYFQSKNGINLLYSETVKCFRREWLLPNDHESDEMLQKRLHNSEMNPTDENKKAFINLARSQKYFSCFQFGPCFWLVDNNNLHIIKFLADKHL